jgi:hypothetical protein
MLNPRAVVFVLFYFAYIWSGTDEDQHGNEGE